MRLQWRFNYAAKTAWEVWTFAIPFSSTTYWCYASMQYADSSGKAWGHIYNKTRTGCNMVMDTTTCDYLVIGYQQWSANIVSFSSNYQTLSFPIAFTAIYSCIVSGGDYSNYTTETWKPEGQIKITNLSNTGFKTPYSGPKWYIAMGCN